MFSFNNDTPIYLQIVDLIRNDISSGKLKPGQKLPSVREYALEFKVNPNTICKAMQILEDKKIIYTERTNGKFVTMDSSIIKDYKKDIFNEMVSSFLEELQSMGYSKEEIIKKQYGKRIRGAKLRRYDGAGFCGKDKSARGLVFLARTGKRRVR